LTEDNLVKVEENSRKRSEKLENELEKIKKKQDQELFSFRNKLAENIGNLKTQKENEIKKLTLIFNNKVKELETKYKIESSMENYKELSVPNNFKESNFISDISFSLNNSFEIKQRKGSC